MLSCDKCSIHADQQCPSQPCKYSGNFTAFESLPNPDFGGWIGISNFGGWGESPIDEISTICRENFHLIKISWFYNQHLWNFFWNPGHLNVSCTQMEVFFLKVLLVPRWLKNVACHIGRKPWAGIDMAYPSSCGLFIPYLFGSHLRIWKGHVKHTPSQKGHQLNRIAR